MAIIIDGRLMAFLLLITFIFVLYLMMYLGKTGKTPTIRRMPAIAALDEAVGRASEMGKTLFYTTGVGGLQIASATQGPQTLASISILEYVSRLAARNGVRIDLFTPIADALPLMEETMRNGYHLEGAQIEFSPDMIHFVPEYDPYVAAALGYLQREKPASTMLFGGFASEAVILGEGGNTINAMQIGGTANTGQIPFLIATCDYVLISEELYAASAAISKDPDTLGSLSGEDIIKFAIIALICIGFLVALTGNTSLVNLLKV